MIIVKIGGGEKLNLDGIVEDLAALTEPFIIIHGANALRDQIAKKMGFDKKVITSASGYTSVFSDNDALDAILMAYSGLRNKRLVEMFQQKGDSECRNGPLAIGIVGGAFLGFMGYKNEASIIMGSSSGSLLYASVMLGDRMDAPDMMVGSIRILGGVGGAYLGYRLWRVRQPTGPFNLFKTPKSIWSRASVSPYLNRERSGLVLSGLF